MRKMNLWQGVMLLGGLVILAGCGQSWSGKELETEKTAVNLVREASRGGYRIIPTPEMKAWLEAKKEMLIVDTMPFEESYQKHHLPGAVQFEFPIPEVQEMDDAARAKFEKVLGPDQDRLIVFYCGFTKCTRSHNGALWAGKLGYRNVYRYPGGIKAWLEAGYPVEKVQQ